MAGAPLAKVLAKASRAQRPCQDPAGGPLILCKRIWVAGEPPKVSLGSLRSERVQINEEQTVVWA